MSLPTEALSSESAHIERINELSTGLVPARCLHVIADLGVADLIDDTPRTPAELAEELAVDASALARMMRLLSSHDVFEQRGEKFAHSPLSRLLRTDHPKSQRAWIRMVGSDLSATLIQRLDHCLKTGKPAVGSLEPPGVFDYLAAHPEDAARFNSAMASKSRADIAAILNAYDFSAFAAVGDIGGGHGHLLRAVLEKTPSAKGVLFDLPHAVEAARTVPADRLELMAGDFFKTPLPACDCYILMNVIHDWSDDDSVAILKAVRKAAPRSARLLLCEVVLPELAGSRYLLMMDVSMLAITGGRERKLAEYQHLLRTSGWLFQRAIPTQASMAILEAIAMQA